MKKTKGKKGRKPSFKPEMLPTVFKLAVAGNVQEEIARKLGISSSRFSEWKTLYPELAEVLNRAKNVPDAKVQQSLYRMAVGYYQEVEEPVFDRKNGEVAYARYKKYFPPSTTAAIFWMKNRRRSEWNDTLNVEQTVNVFVDMPQRETREQWIARVEEEERKRNAIDVTPTE